MNPALLAAAMIPGLPHDQQAACIEMFFHPDHLAEMGAMDDGSDEAVEDAVEIYTCEHLRRGEYPEVAAMLASWVADGF